MKLIEWLTEQLRERPPAVTRVELRHLPIRSSKPGHALLSLAAGEGLAGELAIAIEERAAQDASAMGGVQRYCVLVYREGVEQSTSSYRFRSAAADGADGVDSEPANAEGLLVQTQRHLEAVMRISVTAQGATIETLQRELARLSKENDRLQSKHLEVLEHTEALMSQRHARDIEERKAEAQNKAMGDLVGEFKLLAPAVIARLTGDTSGLALRDPQALQLASIFKSLDDRQRDGIMSLLSQAQQIALGELLQGTN